MSIPDFLTDVLESALDQGIGTPSDVLRHATPEELSRHLPRPVWKQLITAALASSRTDARLVVDTVTIATICKHLPSTIVWACVAELGGRSLSKPLVAAPAGRERPPTGAPAGRERASTGVPAAEAGERPPGEQGGRAGSEQGRGASEQGRGASEQGARAATSPGLGPNAGKKPPPVKGGKARPRAEDDDIEVDVAEERKAADSMAIVDVVDDEQLIDWAQSEELAAGDAAPDTRR